MDSMETTKNMYSYKLEGGMNLKEMVLTQHIVDFHFSQAMAMHTGK